MAIYRAVLSVVVLAGAVGALALKGLVRAALAMGVGSAALAMLFFSLGAPYAGGFELSVGTGLVSVLLLIGISLTRSIGSRRDDTA